MRRRDTLVGAMALLFQATLVCVGPATAEYKPDQLAARAAAPGHPRLFIRQADVDRLRQVILTSHRAKWEKLKAAVDTGLNEEPPEYKPPEVGGDSTRPRTLNDEMLWQRVYGYKLAEDVAVRVAAALDLAACLGLSAGSAGAS